MNNMMMHMPVGGGGGGGGDNAPSHNPNSNSKLMNPNVVNQQMTAFLQAQGHLLPPTNQQQGHQQQGQTKQQGPGQRQGQGQGQKRGGGPADTQDVASFLLQLKTNQENGEQQEQGGGGIPHGLLQHQQQHQAQAHQQAAHQAAQQAAQVVGWPPAMGYYAPPLQPHMMRGGGGGGGGGFLPNNVSGLGSHSHPGYPPQYQQHQPQQQFPPMAMQLGPPQGQHPMAYQHHTQHQHHQQQQHHLQHQHRGPPPNTNAVQQQQPSAEPDGPVLTDEFIESLI